MATKGRAPTKDTGYSWVILVASLLLSILLSSCYSTLGVYFVEFVDYFQEDKTALGWIGTCQMSMMGFAGIFAGPIAKAYGCRVLVSLGVVLQVVGYVSSAFTTNLHALYFTYGILAGIGFGFHIMCAGVAVQQYFDKRRSTAAGLVLTGNSVGAFIWPPLAEWLIQVYTWRGALVVQAGIYLNGFVIAGLLRPFPSEQQSLAPADGGGRGDNLVGSTDSLGLAPIMPHQDTTEDNIPKQTCRPCTINSVCNICLLKDPAFLLFCIGIFGIEIGHFGVYSFLPLRGVGLGATNQQAALLASILGGCSGVSRVAFGLLGDRISKLRPLCSGLGAVTTGTLSALSMLLPSYSLVACYAALYSVISACYVALQFTLVVDILGVDHAAQGIGVFMACLGCSTLILYPVSGILIDATDNAAYPFLFFGVCLFAGGLFHCAVQCLLTRRRRQKRARSVS